MADIPSDVVHTHIVQPLFDNLNKLQQKITEAEHQLTQAEEQLETLSRNDYTQMPTDGTMYLFFKKELPQWIKNLTRECVELRRERETLKQVLKNVMQTQDIKPTQPEDRLPRGHPLLELNHNAISNPYLV